VTTINATVPGNGSANPTDPESIGGNYVTGSIYNYDNGSAYQDAFIYTVGQADATDIIPESNSCGYAVNSSGTVVGISTNTSGVNSAFIYSGGTVTNLSTLISGTNPFSSIECANGISDNGEYIVGYGIENSTGDTTAFLLTAVPTPEPTTLLLAASGLIGLLAYAWRKRK
jgi:probable HAF family extracellular repeat protein